jgi:hypothetical protein
VILMMMIIAMMIYLIILIELAQHVCRLAIKARGCWIK